MGKPILCLDFDGVLHGYQSGWRGVAVIPDPPVPGALEFARAAVSRFEVVVHSSRCADIDGLRAVIAWLDDHDFPSDIQVAAVKPPAHVTLDDRALTFDGTWPDLDALAQFVPWTDKRSLSCVTKHSQP